MQQFNFFKILEKDNKELIHSAFISYLLDNNSKFREFLELGNEIFSSSQLEKQYNHKKEKCRIDIELISEDRNHFVFVENKFKSFPYSNQLNKYDRIFKHNVHSKAKLTKILLCFDKEIIGFQTEWKIYDYNDIVNFLEENFNLNDRYDEAIFINHYHQFLKEYINTYKSYQNNSVSLFNGNLSNDEKFWLRLINSQIVLYFQTKYNNDLFNFVSNPGNTSTPLLNITPLGWKAKVKEDVLIQFQGRDLKFYIHSVDKERIKKVIDFCSKRLWDEKLELKKPTKRKEGSCFIFKTRINDVVINDFSIANICKTIEGFYENIEEKIIKNYT
ncbi:PD-(D/E)XK nuclease family protein [Flavobacterium hibisci]|uniref:PD-(D/E)XK nuclease family protein n=1 Tax=Flavobacterium hibisci TaxID=1914462 RepID=UPI001CBB00DD|nr:PD-(D/E)XK nuclease family protein [Flavobacterium hibisci]MBZ4041353.1 PD-(D/E)XK nuclease family protein [Flavobacterium hibisci]